LLVKDDIFGSEMLGFMLFTLLVNNFTGRDILAICNCKNIPTSKTYNKINGAIRRHFGKQMNKEAKLRIHNITTKAALKFGSEAWVLKKREEQRLEASQMKFLRHILGITKLDKEKN